MLGNLLYLPKTDRILQKALIILITKVCDMTCVYKCSCADIIIIQVHMKLVFHIAYV